MEENKNLTPENGEENTEVVSAEEIAEGTTEEVVPEKAEEVAETSEEIIEEIAEEAIVTEEAEPKKSKGGVVAAIIAACAAVAIIILAAMFFFKPAVTEGTGNFYSHGFATVKGDQIYHVNFLDSKMYKTNIKTGESEIAYDSATAFIMNYKNDIYYVNIGVNEETQESILQFRKYVDGVNDIALFSDSELGMPQVSDGYVYFLRSVTDLYSGYSSHVYRAALKENSEPELVCDVLCNSFYVNGNDLYYGDVETTSFVKTTIETAMNVIAQAPLADGATRKSADIGATNVVSTIVACPAIVDGTLYYIDSLNQYELRKLDLKTMEDSSFNNGIYAVSINIYGDNIYYYNLSDYCIYRMKLDGTDVMKMTAPGYGLNAISHDKFMAMEFTEEGYQYIAVNDLEGNRIFDITFDEQYEELLALYEEEMASENAEAEGTEETAAEGTEETMDTTIDMEE